MLKHVICKLCREVKYHQRKTLGKVFHGLRIEAENRCLPMVRTREHGDADGEGVLHDDGTKS